MSSVLAIERTGLDGSRHTSLWQLLATLLALWLPTGLLWGLLWACQGPGGGLWSNDIMDTGLGSEPRGELTVVLTVPTASLFELSVLWWGWRVIVNEYRRHNSRHRRRRRKFMDKLMQRAVTAFIVISLFATIPAFAWSMLRFYQSCVPTGRMHTIPM